MKCSVTEDRESGRIIINFGVALSEPCKQKIIELVREKIGESLINCCWSSNSRIRLCVARRGSFSDNWVAVRSWVNSATKKLR